MYKEHFLNKNSGNSRFLLGKGRREPDIFLANKIGTSLGFPLLLIFSFFFLRDLLPRLFSPPPPPPFSYGKTASAPSPYIFLNGRRRKRRRRIKNMRRPLSPSQSYGNASYACGEKKEINYSASPPLLSSFSLTQYIYIPPPFFFSCLKKMARGFTKPTKRQH